MAPTPDCEAVARDPYRHHARSGDQRGSGESAYCDSCTQRSTEGAAMAVARVVPGMWRPDPEWQEPRRSSAVEALWIAATAEGLLRDHTERLLDTALWAYTEAANGVPPRPLHNQRYRSSGALNGSPDLVHEHVHERRKVKSDLLQGVGDGWSRDDVAGYIARNGDACVVTRAEHAALNLVHPALHGWERYSQAGIIVWDMQSGQRLALPQVPPLPRVVFLPEDSEADDAWIGVKFSEQVDERVNARVPKRIRPAFREFLARVALVGVEPIAPHIE